MQRRTLWLALPGLLIGAAAGAWYWRSGWDGTRFPAEFSRALARPQEMWVLGIDPDPGVDGKEDQVGHYRVTQTRKVADGQFEAVAAALRKAALISFEMKAQHGCFNPRQAVRVRQGGRNYEWLLCFECEKYLLYKDGKPGGSGSLAMGRAPKILEP